MSYSRTRKIAPHMETHEKLDQTLDTPKTDKITVNQFQLASCEVAELHSKTRKIYSSISKQTSDPVSQQDLFNITKCPCCDHPAEGQNFSFFCKVNDFSELGSSFPLFFTVVKYLVISLFLVLLIAGIPCLVNNYIQDNYSDWTNEKSVNVLTPANFGDSLNAAFWQPILHICACGSLVFFYAWIIRSVKEKSVEFDANTTLPSDFTIMVRNLPEVYTKEQLAKHIEHNFQLRGLKIVNIVCTYDIKDYVECKKELEDYKAQYILVKNYEERYNKPLIIKSCFKSTELQGSQECEEKIKELESKLKQLNDQMRTEKLAPVAFVMLNSQTNARLIVSEWGRTTIQSIFDLIFSHFVNKRQWFLGNYIYCEMSPDHTDINWENLAVTNKAKLFKRFSTIFVGLLTLVFATGIMAGTSKWKAEVYSNKKSESADSIRAATIIPTMVTVFTNFTVSRLIRIFSLKEKYATWTDYNGSVLNKLVIFYILNNIGIPLFVYSDPESEWFSPGGLAYTVFWLQILNSCASPVIYLINPKNQFKKLNRFLMRRSEKAGDIRVSQKVANLTFEGPEVDLADRFANIIKIFTMCLFYAPIVPIAVPIGIFGMLFEALIFKFMLIRVHSKPKLYNSDLVIRAAEWMKWSLFVYSLGILVFYQKIVPELWILELFFFIAMAGYVLTPISTICLCCFKDQTLEIIERMFEGDSTQNNFFYAVQYFLSDFERENPATCEEGVKRWKRYMVEKTEDSYLNGVWGSYLVNENAIEGKSAEKSEKQSENVVKENNREMIGKGNSPEGLYPDLGPLNFKLG